MTAFTQFRAALLTLLLSALPGFAYAAFEHISQGLAPAPGEFPSGAVFNAVSANGNRVVFSTFDRLTADDTDSRSDIYLRDSGMTTRVSQGAINGNGDQSLNHDVRFLGMSSDGSRIFFDTGEKLHIADTNDFGTDVYMRENGVTTLISQGANGNGPNGGNVIGGQGGISADGSRVFFSSNDRLTAADVDNSTDLYLRQNGVTTLITPAGSKGGDNNGTKNFGVEFKGITPDGSRVYFQTYEPLGNSEYDTNGNVIDTYTDLYERTVGVDGQPSGFNHISEGLSAPDGFEFNGGFIGTGPVRFLAASTDGARVFFSTARNPDGEEQDVGGLPKSDIDIYLRENDSSSNVTAGTFPQQIGNNNFESVQFGAISPDGSRLYFTCFSKLVATDTDEMADIYVRDIATGQYTQVSLSATGGNGNFEPHFAVATADGGRVFFETQEPLSASDTDTQYDLYLREGGVTTHLTQGNGAFGAGLTAQAAPDGARTNSASIFDLVGGINSSGSKVIFSTLEPLAASDTDDQIDLYQVENGVTTHITNGVNSDSGQFHSKYAGMSADSTLVFFETGDKLAATDPGRGSTDVYVITPAVTPTQRALTVTPAGTGSGAVTGTGISCPGDCAENYTDGTMVTLTAAPAANSDFAGFSGGGCSGAALTCGVTMDAAKTVTANFTLKQRVLTVTPGGSGTGTVTGTGISCPGDCTESFADGTAVTLTAAPASGSTFAGFSGGGCSGTALTCNVTMDAAKTVTATFTATVTPTQRALAVTPAGTGTGTVTGTGISCPGDCTESFADGTAVTLTAAPASGSTFAGFSGGGCSGTALTCNVTMDAAKTVTATFTSFFTPPTQPSRTLNVTPSGTGTGTVTSAPAGINCTMAPTGCSSTFADGTAVTLFASPAAGSVFMGFSGDCTGSTCSNLTMSADRTVTATFARGSSTVAVNDGTGRPVNFTTSAGTLAGTTQVSQPAAAPSGLVFPVGFFAFDVTGLAVGQTIVVSIVLPAGLGADRYIKCNGVTCATFAGAVFSGDTVSLTLTDGGAGDTDGLANGTIRDPGAPAFGAAGGGGGGGGGGAFGALPLLLLSLLGLLKRRKNTLPA